MALDFTQTDPTKRPFATGGAVEGRGAEWLIGPTQNQIWAPDVDQDAYLAVRLTVMAYVNGDRILSISRTTGWNVLLGLGMTATGLQLQYRTNAAGSGTKGLSIAPPVGQEFLVEIVKTGNSIVCTIDGVHAGTVTNARALMFTTTETDSATPIGLLARADGSAPSAVTLREVVIGVSATDVRVRLGAAGIIASDGRVETWTNTAGGVVEPPETLVFGTQTHCAQSMLPEIYGQLKTATPNVRIVRDELYWNSVYDAATNVWAFKNPKFEAYLDAIAASGHHLLLELLWGHAVVTNGTYNLPRGTEQRAAFCDYASWVINAAKARNVTLHGCCLWNEISGSWPGTEGRVYDDLSVAERDTLADDYMLLLKEVRVRLNTDHPGLKLAAGADVIVRMDWLNRVIARGLLDHCDVLDLHPYSGAANNLPALRQAMAAAGKADFPIWVTEFGSGSTDAERQAYAVRVGAQCIAAGAKLLTWYPARPYGSFARGLLTANGGLSPEGVTFEWFAGIMAGCIHDGPVTGVPLGVSGERFTTRDDERVAIIWSTGGVQVAISGQTRIQEATSPQAVVEAAASYTVTASPLIVFGPDVTITAAAGGDVVLADFAAQFSQVQGQPWEYGSYDPQGAFQPATWSVDRWKAPIGEYHWLRYDAMHPHVGWWVTARIKFAENKRLKLTGFFSRNSTGGDSVDVRIRVGSTVVGAGHLTPAVSAAYSIVADVPANTYVEFSVDPLASNTTDATKFQAIIRETTDQPSTIPVVIGEGAVEPPPPPPPPPPPDGEPFTLAGLTITEVYNADGTITRRWTLPLASA